MTYKNKSMNTRFKECGITTIRSGLRATLEYNGKIVFRPEINDVEKFIQIEFGLCV
jgi:hypothetical protein